MTVADVMGGERVRAGDEAGAARQPAASGAAGDADDALVRQCLQGDAHAFDSLVLAYRARVHGLARLTLGSAEDAHDVTQETFVRAYEALPRYRPRGQFRVWLYTIAANLCRNRLKARRPAVSWEAPEMTESLIDPEPGPEAAALARERGLAVREAVAQMGARDRLMVVLYYQEDVSLEEIARIVGCRRGAAKVALHRARVRLRERLKALGFE
jgi:RNA polymerase sigma-70 factor (ECF subfamily)